MMQKLTYLTLIVLILGCQSEPADSSKIAAEKSDQRPLAITNPDPIQVTVLAGVETSPFAPRYSPPGKALELTPVQIPEGLGFDGLEAEVILGWPLNKQKPIKLLVTRSASDAAYTNLYIDADGNGQFDEEAIVAKASESRGNIWSSFSATMKVHYLTENAVTEDYPVALWIAVASASEQPKVLRLSRRGFKIGDLKIDDQKLKLVLSDSNNDAIFGEGDWWELRTDDGTTKGSGSAMRRVGEYHWVGERAYKLDLDDASGNVGRISLFDPGKSREQDELDRDPFSADRKAVKAENPLEFRHDVDEAIAEAAERKQRCFIKFETTWCGPCKTMTQYVFTAKEVVDASNGIVCVKVDGDERRDLVERYAVKAYPTGVLMAADGTEALRFVGYQSVGEMAKFLKAK